MVVYVLVGFLGREAGVGFGIIVVLWCCCGMGCLGLDLGKGCGGGKGWREPPPQRCWGEVFEWRSALGIVGAAAGWCLHRSEAKPRKARPHRGNAQIFIVVMEECG